MSGQKLKVLIACEDINYNKTSGGLVNTKIIARLAADPDFSLSLISMGDMPSGFPAIFSGSHQHIQAVASGVWRLISQVPGLRGILERSTGINHHMVHRYRLWKNVLQQALTSEVYDAVLVLSAGMGWYVHLAMRTLPKLQERRIYAFHDPYPMALLPPIKRSRWPRSQRLLLQKMNEVVADADAIWMPSFRLQQWLEPWYPGLASKAVIFPHLAVLPPALAPGAAASPIPEWHASQRFTILHMGSLLEGRSPEGFLKAAITWLSHREEAAACTTIAFIGRVPEGYLPMFQDVQQHPNFSIRLGERLPYQDALALQQSVAVNLVIESKSSDSPQLLGKMADGVWANRPLLILGHPGSEARRIMGEQYIFQAFNDDVLAIERLLDALFEAWQQAPNRTLGRDDLQAYMSGDAMVKALKHIGRS